MTSRRIVLIDGSSLAFRAFYAMGQVTHFTNQAGLHTNALYSFNRMLDNVLEEFAPSHILVAFDKSGPTFRTELYEDYKGGRSKAPSEFTEQMPYFSVLLDARGIKTYAMDYYEADDIIGTFSRLAVDEDEVHIISGDRDLIQLANDQTTVHITRKGVSQLVAYTPAVIEEEWQITPAQIIDLKGLMGDSSDNYPGVTRVGEKTALKLLHQFGSMDGLYQSLDDLKPSKMKDNLISDRDQAYLSRELAEINCQVPVELGYDDIIYLGDQVEPLMDFYRQMDFQTFLSDLQAEHGVSVSLSEAEAQQVPDFSYEFVNEIEPHQLPDRAAYYVEALDENYHVAEIEAVSWADLDQARVFVAEATTVQASANFKNWLADDSKTKLCLDAKREQVLAHRMGMTLSGVIFDASITSYLIDTHNSQDLADMLASQELPVILQPDEVFYGKGAKRAVPEDREAFYDHLTHKLTALSMLEAPLLAALEASEMMDLYQEIELPLAAILAQIEITGIRVDGEILEAKNQELIERLAAMEADIYELAGEEFNVNSPKQLGVILFEKLGLPVIKKTKTGYSTAADVLEKLQDAHPIIDLILDYRQIAKLQGTYLAGLPEYIQADGKIHTRLIQTLTQTGRLSSADPNLQNIPVRLEEGRRIRQAFIPAHEGWQFFGADYSQIELRVLAHISQDEHMQEAFNQGEDIHTATAQRVFNLSADQIDANVRRQAKAVNFGIVYGISDYGLSQNLNISRPQAKKFIDTYFEKYPDIQRYMKEIVEQARQQGYVKTLFNRRRYLPDINASNFNVRSFAERTAINSPIQGSAADIIKIAMIKLDRALRERQLQSRLVLQVHDELILEGPSEEMEILSDLVPEIMDSAVELSVPLEVEYDQGNNWYEI